MAKYFVTWSNIKMRFAKWQKEPVLNHLIFPVILRYQIAKYVFSKKFDGITLHLLSYVTVLSLWEISVIKIGYNSFRMSLFSDVSSFPSLITLLKCKPEDDTPLLKWSPESLRFTRKLSIHFAYVSVFILWL